MHVNTPFSELGSTEERPINGENKRNTVECAHMFMQESLVSGFVFYFFFRLEVSFIWHHRETGEGIFRHIMEWNHFKSMWLSGMTWKNGTAVFIHSLLVCVN